MINVEEKTLAFEYQIKRFNKADEIVFMLLTANSQIKPLLDDIAKLERAVKDVDDENLTELYDKLLVDVKRHKAFPGSVPVSYYSFVQRLGTLLVEITIQINEADIALREAIGIQPSTGIWGDKGWSPLMSMKG